MNHPARKNAPASATAAARAAPRSGEQLLALAFTSMTPAEPSASLRVLRKQARRTIERLIDFLDRTEDTDVDGAIDDMPIDDDELEGDSHLLEVAS